ncbi:hypothetical protein QWZ13_14880 [Reinekea marina]|uniref:Uncharacterized protein n=1 Tax=Reinekea marina TaxID=1310421 RepID=A0ABV7WUC9_9GAMM|nr:hypothetical protein [Reinekea marina]MDN3650201.1 hypothetical protein [Reinekea marina]
MLFKWFAEQYSTFEGRSSEHEVELQMYKKAISERFSDKHVRVRRKKVADNLTENEITTIEHFLRPNLRLEKQPKLCPAQAIRNYPFWRLVIDFVLREGEILALRLEDRPHRDQIQIKIVRIEERGAMKSQNELFNVNEQ